MDVCYGGLRLEMPTARQLPSRFDVEVTGIGLHLEVEPVWSYPADDGSARLRRYAGRREYTPAARTWRAIVDRLNA